MRSVALLDTGVASNNLGDEIIMDAVRKILRKRLSDAYLYTVSTHDGIGRTGRKIVAGCDFGIVGGTNILSSNLIRGATWRISPLDLGHLKEIVLMGVGWRDYHPQVNAYARYLYERILSRRYSHSYRDQHTTGMAAQLKRRGANTACPTMWDFDAAHCASIPVTKARNVVTALTYYRPNPTSDRALLDLLRERYEKVFFWIQQAEDLAYFKSLGDYRFEILPPNVPALTALLDREDVDSVGSRLHGGIHALQRGRRTLILAVDNRATEIGRDTGLPVVDRSALHQVADWIGKPTPTKIDLPDAAIAAWIGQFDTDGQP